MINFFIAHMREAMPIRKYYSIHEKVDNNLFQIFTDTQQIYSLTVTGQGKTNAAAAVANTYHCLSLEKADIFLNIGIAGHKEYPIGTPLLIDKISQQDHQCWYPQIIFSCEIQRASSKSLDIPSSEYEGCVFDMELSGLYPIWMKFALAELCHSIKVISDNQENNLKQIDTKECEQLIENNLPAIDRILDQLKEIQKDYTETTTLPNEYSDCIDTWHFSETQKVQLKKLLFRWQNFYSNTSVIEKFKHSSNSKEFLKRIDYQLKDLIGLNQ